MMNLIIGLILGFQSLAWASPEKCDNLLSELSARLRNKVDLHVGPDIQQVSRVQTQLINLKLRQTTSDPEIVKEKLGVVSFNTTKVDSVSVQIKYTENVPALVRLDNNGLSIYHLDRDGELVQFWGQIHQFGTEVAKGFVEGDKVGPTNLIVHNLSESGLQISYTNGLYLNSVRIVDSAKHSNFVMSTKIPNAPESTYIKNIFPVDVKSEEIKTLYWAQTDKIQGSLFTYNKKGSAVFLDPSRIKGSKMEALYGYLTEISKLSDLVSRRDLFIPSLSRDYRDHFPANDPQTRPGGRYHYVFKWSDLY